MCMSIYQIFRSKTGTYCLFFSVAGILAHSLANISWFPGCVLQCITKELFNTIKFLPIISPMCRLYSKNLFSDLILYLLPKTGILIMFEVQDQEIDILVIGTLICTVF